MVPDNTKNADNAAKNAEPLINLDVNNPDFKAGVMALANLLQIQRHDDYLVMLKAIRILVQERLTQDAVAKANQKKVATGNLRISLFHPHYRTNSKLFWHNQIIQQNYAFGLEGSANKAITK